MTVENELKALRYLVNDLILYIYDLRIKLDEIVPTSRKYVTREPNANGSSIGFDLFTVPKDKYNNLIDRFGIDVVNRACVKLDEFIKLNEYIPYNTASNSLARKFIPEVIKEEYGKGKTDA
jgi:hypothetical protein